MKPTEYPIPICQGKSVFEKKRLVCCFSCSEKLIMIFQKSEMRLKKEGVVLCFLLFSRLKRDFLSTGVPILRLAFSFFPCSKTPSAARQILLCCTADLKMVRTRSFRLGIVVFFSLLLKKKSRRTEKVEKVKKTVTFVRLLKQKGLFCAVLALFLRLRCCFTGENAPLGILSFGLKSCDS